jgi:hypothetical protein
MMNKMNKILKYFTVLLLGFLIQGCGEDYLALENKNRLALSSFYKTANDADMALNTCYNGLAFGGMFGNNYFLFFNSFDDRIFFESTGMDNFNINSSNSGIASMYQALYVGLWRSSSVIYNLRTRSIPDLKDKDKELLIAQAKALRAMYYFYLVVLFNEPYFYDDYNMPEDYTLSYGNSDPALFWSKMRLDLEEAIPVLPAKYDAVNLGRITSGAAEALLGKAMLYKHYYFYMKNGLGGSAEDIADMQVGKAHLDSVIHSGTYSLIQPQAPYSRKDYINAFLCNFSYLPLPSGSSYFYPSENNDESIWEVQYSDERIAGGWLPGWQWSGSLNVQYFSAHESSYRNHEVNPALFLQFETTGVPAGLDRDPRAYGTCYLDGDSMDFRPDLYYSKPYKSGVNNKTIAKGRNATYPGQPSLGFGLKKYSYPVYNEKDAPKNDPINIRIIRFSDVKLMYAELAYLLDEDMDLGLAQLNDVRARAGMAPVAELNRTAIMHERDVELALEGHRFLDLVRWSFDPAWGVNWYALLGNSSFIKNKNEYLPIPIEEINLNNGALKQNPGW